MRLIWDLETDGLMDTVTTIHSLLMKDIDTGQVYSCHNQNWINPNSAISSMSIEDGLRMLSTATLRIGHNTLKYDLQVLAKLSPTTHLTGVDWDTMVLAKLIYPDIKEYDSKAIQSKRIDPNNFKAKGRSLFGSHSLAAWGHRIGEHKVEYIGGFDKWSPEMQQYGEQDIETTFKLFQYLKPFEYSQEAITLEHRTADILARVERDGIPFSMPKAVDLQAKLVKRKEELKQSLIGLFPDWQVEVKRFIAKANNKKLGRKKGDEIVVHKTIVFNPGSREHIAKCLIDKYGWVPQLFTEKGKPSINDDVLQHMEYPEAKTLAEYFVVCKVLGYLADGPENWMDFCKGGVIHAGYNPIGTVTSRCSHMKPPIGTVPAVDKPYGAECRGAFANAGDNEVLVGTDMAGLELRCLAHYLYTFDGGEYVELVTKGDVHTANMTSAGLETRALAKTMIYLTIYGGGGDALYEQTGIPVVRAKKIIKDFKKNTRGFKTMEGTVTGAAERGWVKAIDGRRVPIRKAYAALNSLLQSCGAVICKRWMVGIYDALEGEGLVYGRDYRYVAFIHDELQIMCRKGLEVRIGETSGRIAKLVGEELGMKCPLAADYKVGQNWAETH